MRSPTTTRLLTVCAKKDVKKKAKAEVADAPGKPQPAAPRLLPNAIPGVSFKQHYAWVQIKKARASELGTETELRAPSRPIQLPKAAHVASSEELAEAQRERELVREREKAALLEKDLEEGRRILKSTVILVDAYNLMHVYKPTKELIEQERLDEARRVGVDYLKGHAGWMGQKIVVVFDAKDSGRTDTTREPDGPYIDIVFAAKEGSADAFIEAEVRELAGRHPAPRIVVVSSDHDLRTVASVTDSKSTLYSAQLWLDKMAKADANAKEAMKMGADGRTRAVTEKKNFGRLGNNAVLSALRNKIAAESAAARFSCAGDTCSVEEEAEDDPEGGGALGPRGSRRRKPL